MSSLNQCTFIGNVGKDPEIRSFPNGGRVANFSVACSERWRDKSSGEQKERTEWINIAVKSDGLVGIVERFVKKGSKLLVQGKLQTRKWQDQSGQDRYSTEIVLTNFDGKLLLLDGKQDGQASEPASRSGSRSTAPQSGGFGDLDDEVPF